MISFIFPSEEHEAAVRAFYGEFEEAKGTCIGYGNHEDFQGWLLGMRNRKTGTDLPPGYVRENFYLCYEGREMVGVFSLKFELTPFLLNFGGHIGYAVKPSRRNRGLATEILAQGLREAEKFGFEKILAVCDEDNYASEKVILRNGGVFENRIFDGEEKVFVKRYWIDLKDALQKSE